MMPGVPDELTSLRAQVAALRAALCIAEPYVHLSPGGSKGIAEARDAACDRIRELLTDPSPAHAEWRAMEAVVTTSRRLGIWRYTDGKFHCMGCGGFKVSDNDTDGHADGCLTLAFVQALEAYDATVRRPHGQ